MHYVLVCSFIQYMYVLVIYRDLRDIGCYIKVIDGCQQLDKETRCEYYHCIVIPLYPGNTL